MSKSSKHKVLRAKVVGALIVAVAGHFIEKAVDKYFGV